MNRTGRALTLGCLLLLQPLLALAEGGNSLLIPATGRCTLNVQPEDLQNALKTCEHTAESGDAQAQYELGEFYYSDNGEQAARDLNKALNWFQQASLQGHAQAQYRLGSMFFHGEGVKANNVQAYILLKMAAVNGAEDALDLADEVTEQMPRDELEHATQVLGQIFRKYLLELQNAEGRSPFAPLP
ncbi:tetratricopeptide repeat protein [Pseudomonas shirazensis]|uniref:Tetratricopeptide repeat protein n=1 Tax=Pseudomonas shirazensis TaxID=2745494 RepID=A0ABU9A2D0_9PSED|nr:tetratricopeptide repeat protein [Pseudomonas shirazensis]MBV4502585.1 sel1 repeat family protein [Pseudomonas shirazensis]